MNIIIFTNLFTNQGNEQSQMHHTLHFECLLQDIAIFFFFQPGMLLFRNLQKTFY